MNPLQELTVRLQKQVHNHAICASPLFSVEHWKHHGPDDWPTEPDDDSWLEFENCVNPDCILARTEE